MDSQLVDAVPTSVIDRPAGRHRSTTAAEGRLRRRMGRALAACGPGFVVSVAYVDPGNFATNMTAGSRHGYGLLWVVVAANLVAMLVQYLSAKVGVATGRSLPEVCRDGLPAPLTWLLWGQAELVAMVTDLAEFVGGAVALNLLFGISLFPAAVVTAAVTAAVLVLAPQGRRRFETVVAGMLGVVLVGFLYQALRAGPTADAVRGLAPGLPGGDGLLLAAGILGATVMPHVVYLHSSLTRGDASTGPDGRRRLLRAGRTDLVLALAAAGCVNAAMLVTAAAAFHPVGRPRPTTLGGVHAALGGVVGGGAAVMFALALLAAGLASSSVGTCAGQAIMQGFLRRRVPLAVRRAVTMAPPLVVLGLGVDPTRALVLSQVVLSFGIPFALVPLVVCTARRSLMGPLVNRAVTTVLAVAVCAVVVGLNVVLVTSGLTG